MLRMVHASIHFNNYTMSLTLIDIVIRYEKETQSHLHIRGNYYFRLKGKF